MNTLFAHINFTAGAEEVDSMEVNKRIAAALKLELSQVVGAVALLKEGASIPFLARYRRKQTGGLDEAALSRLKEKLDEFADDESRRETAMKSIRDGGKLTPELEEKIQKAESRDELEDLYMAFRSRRRTRSNAAKHKGLEPLADIIAKQETGTATPDEVVKPFISEEKGVKDVQEALAGARDILAENIAEEPACRKIARDLLIGEGKVTTKPREGVDLSKGKYAAFASFSEPIAKVPGHRLLAAMRGASEKQLYLSLDAPKDKVLVDLKAKVITNAEAPLKAELALAVEECYERLLGPALDNDLRLELKRNAENEAIDVFAKNLRAILLQSPFGSKAVLAVGPATKAPWKIAVIGADGKIVSHTTLQPNKDEEEKKKTGDEIVKLIKEHAITAVAVVNGSGAKEADALIRDALKAADVKDVARVPIHEGASSAFAATAQAREEMPEVDNAMRTTVSVGRRLQDPLAEILKLDLKTIPLGQFQHDVDQAALQRKLEEIARSVVAQVGANVNAASEAVLRYVPGLNAEIAKAIAARRKESGPFKSREELKAVVGIDAKTFQHAAGFLRVSDAENILDRTTLHPERYAVVEALAISAGSTVKDLAGNSEALSKLSAKGEVAGETLTHGEVKEIAAELGAPGRDARNAFIPPQFNEEVQDINDLKEGMVLNGIVTNLAQFGAFIDVGVHQDGLVHISAVTHKFIRDPSEVLTVGQHVKVKVLAVDAEKKRISLSIKALEEIQRRQPRPARAPRENAAPREGAPAQAAGGEGSQQPRQPRRFDRPRGPRPDGRTNVGQVAPSTAPAGVAGEGATVQSPAPAHGDRAPRSSEAPRRDRFSGASDRRAGPGGAGAPRGPGGADRGAPSADRFAPKKPEPGKPDYSKFYVKGKRPMPGKDKKTERPDSGAAASRDEVREVMRKQSTGGTSLADLFKQAGVKEE
ncbi:MAG: Tex-like N-terminal domain-containing protein [Planctomycetota bacterium]